VADSQHDGYRQPESQSSRIAVTREREIRHQMAGTGSQPRLIGGATPAPEKQEHKLGNEAAGMSTASTVRHSSGMHSSAVHGGLSPHACSVEYEVPFQTLISQGVRDDKQSLLCSLNSNSAESQWTNNESHLSLASLQDELDCLMSSQ